MALEEEIGVPEPDKIPRNDIDIENPPNLSQKERSNACNHLKKKIWGGGGEVDALTGLLGCPSRPLPLLLIVPFFRPKALSLSSSIELTK